MTQVISSACALWRLRRWALPHMFRIRQVMVATILTISHCFVSADVYRCTDNDGLVTYSDKADCGNPNNPGAVHASEDAGNFDNSDYQDVVNADDLRRTTADKQKETQR